MLNNGLTINQLQDLILFVKEAGAKSFVIEGVSIEFFAREPEKLPVAAPIEDTKSHEEKMEDVDELLFASAGY